MYLAFRLVLPGLTSCAADLASASWGHEIPVKHRFGFILLPQKPVLGKGNVGPGGLLLLGESCA